MFFVQACVLRKKHLGRLFHPQYGAQMDESPAVAGALPDAKHLSISYIRLDAVDVWWTIFHPGSFNFSFEGWWAVGGQEGHSLLYKDFYWVLQCKITKSIKVSNTQRGTIKWGIHSRITAFNTDMRPSPNGHITILHLLQLRVRSKSIQCTNFQHKGKKGKEVSNMVVHPAAPDQSSTIVLSTAGSDPDSCGRCNLSKCPKLTGNCSGYQWGWTWASHAP